MTEYTAGDLVEAVKGTTVVRARLVERGAYLALGVDLGTVLYYENHFYTITVIEKAAPVVVLPKATVKFANGPIVMWKESFLGWVITGFEDVWGNPALITQTFGSDFTILEPVSETAKKVLDRVNKVWPWGSSTAMLRRVAEEFGVEL